MKQQIERPWWEPYIEEMLKKLANSELYSYFEFQVEKWPADESERLRFVKMIKPLEEPDERTFVYRASTGERHYGPLELGVAYRVQNFEGPGLHR